MLRVPTGEVLTSWAFKNQGQGVELWTTEPVPVGGKTVMALPGDRVGGFEAWISRFESQLSHFMLKNKRYNITFWPLWHPCREACSTTQYVYLVYLPTQI